MSYEDFEDKSVKIDENYFEVTIPDLEPDTIVPIQIRWQYADKTYSGWSASYDLDVPDKGRREVENIVAVWEGKDLIITWDKTSDDATGYTLLLTPTGGTEADQRTFPVAINKTKTQQKFILTEGLNYNNYGQELQIQFDGILKTIYPDGETEGVEFQTPILADPVCSGVIADTEWEVTSIANGILVSWKEGVTNADTYVNTQVYVSETNNPYNWELRYAGVGPATIILDTLATVYIRLRHESITGCFSFWSNVKEGKIYDPIDFDDDPPNEVTGVSAAWSGDDIVVSFTMPATKPATRFRVFLTNGLNTRFFDVRSEGQTGNQSVKITDAQLYGAFGDYYNSFTGVISSVDQYENKSTGVNFTVPEKANPLLGVVPTFVLTGISNGYTATWVLPATAYQAKVYESGTSWGAGNPIESELVFTGQSPAIIKKTVYTKRYVKIKYVTKNGSESSWSTEGEVTPLDPIQVDNNPPTNPTNISATAQVDPNDNTGFSLKSTISFTKSVDATCRGYRIRWTTQTSNQVYEYAFVEHPTSPTVTTVSYTVTGLIPNVTYYYDIAAVDEFNNTAAYATGGTFTAQDSVATAEGSLARLKSFISIGGATGDQFKFGTGIAESINISTNTTPSLSAGTYHGILLNKTGNKNNYWLTTGQIRVGTDTQFMYFNGTNFYVTGDINAASGKFSGNIELSTTGASIWNGPLNSAGNIAGDGFVLNNSGLALRKTVGGATRNVRLDTTDGGIYADYGNIAGWTIDTNRLERGTGAVNNLYAGISSAGTYAFWAGSTGSGGNATANFLVTPAGKLTAKGVSIVGGDLAIGGDGTYAGSPFAVNTSGTFKATDAEINGTVRAVSGILGSIDIGGTINGVVREGQLRITIPGATGGKIEMGKLTNPLGATVSAGIQVTNITNGVEDRYAQLDPINGIIARKGTIGGWTIDSTSINKANNIGFYAPTGTPTNSEVVIWAGGTRGGTDKFNVTYGGTMTAKNAYIYGSIYANVGGFGTFNALGTDIATGWKINGSSIESTGYSTGTTIVKLDGNTGSIIGGNFYIGSSTSATDYIKSDGTLSLGAGKITYSSGTLTIQNTTYYLNITSNEDGTFGDSTVVQDEGTKQMTIGRAFFYGGTTDPRTGGPLGAPVTTRLQYNAGSQGTTAFNIGDIWLQRV